MKATVNLDDRLYRRVKVAAAENGVTVTSIFEAALRRYLDEPAGMPGRDQSRFEIPVLDGAGGLIAGVDLANGDELARIMDLDVAPGQYR